MGGGVETGYQNFDGRHIWFVKSNRGGVHIWACRHHPEIEAQWGDRYYGGIEIHSPSPLHSDCQASHDDCWLLKVPCWHDGSSLQFETQIAPMLRDHADVRKMDDYIFSKCLERYCSYFDPHADEMLVTRKKGEE